MRARDLMQGDYITFKEALKDCVVVLVKIVGIGYCGRGVEDEVLAEIDGDTSCDIIEIDDECVGIPLTPEILEKNGFIYKKLKGVGDNEIWRIEDDYYDIDIYEWSDSIWIFRYDCNEMSLPHTQVTMSYVHELQHALRLCGIEKEITI